MGVDLKLLPLLQPGFWTAHDELSLARRSDLWPEIEKLEQIDIPEPVWCYHARTPEGDTCYGRVETTPYGDRMKWTTAEQLLTLSNNEFVQDNWKNRAVWAYLAQMPADYPLVLYWH